MTSNLVSSEASTSFFYHPDLELDNVVPSLGPVTGGTPVVIDGLAERVTKWLDSFSVEPEFSVVCRFADDVVQATIVDDDYHCVSPASTSSNKASMAVSFERP